MDSIVDTLRWAFGTDTRPDDWGVLQLAARALSIYLAALVLVRLGKNRFLGKNTAFDVVLGFIFGSMLSRAINSSPALIGTMLAAAVMIGLHWILSVVAQRSKRLSRLLRGDENVLVRDGVVDRDQMKRALVTDGDLQEALRLNGSIDSARDAKCAVLERNGSISVIPQPKRQPTIVEVRVEPGVQVVRIELC